MGFRSKQILGFLLLIIGLVLCSGGVWLLSAPPQYQATAQIQLPDTQFTYSWQEVEAYLKIHPERELEFGYHVDHLALTVFQIESDSFLSNFIAQAKQGNFSKSAPRTVGQFKNHLLLIPKHKTGLIEISFTSRNAKEAADIANAIAKAYQDNREQNRKAFFETSIRVLAELYQQEETQIHTVETNEDRLNLGTMNENHKLIAAKIEAEKSELNNSNITLVKITASATPPTSTVGPNHFLVAAVIVVGLVSSLSGGLLYASSRRPSPAFRRR